MSAILNRQRPALLALSLAWIVAGFLGLGYVRVAAADAPKEWDGLVLQQGKRLSLIYVRPGASLAGYKRVRLERLRVSFDKNWKPNDTKNLSRHLSKEDFEMIKNALADEFGKTFAAELAKGGYKVVDESGEDVLDITPLVIDLYISAPEGSNVGTRAVYTADPGRMTLVAELRDSVTNQILFRVVDTRRAEWGDTYQMGTGASNMAAAQRVIALWASALREALDEAEGRKN
jgi:Protein of unknown function (DUF3313)